ncbi:hypothetical protein [Brachyspira sp.]|uniref:hypothetical protein n=1 Tax=Brachyspira sp. TaxID=1977261 RepID=UPI00263576F7|nr:hypothetical protein [Brachyspira sp.]
MKKIILSVLIFISISFTSFAAGGFEFIINVPVGISLGIYDYDLTDYAENQDIIQGGAIRNKFSKNAGIGLDVGVTAQLGYMIKFTDNIGLSILGEVGYSHDTYSYISKIDKNISETYTYESLQFGLIPKFNINNFAIGIGGGVKIPLAGNMHTKLHSLETDVKLDSDRMKRMFKAIAIPYIKLTFDYSIFFTEKTAFNIGLYLGYDFGMESNLYDIDGAINNNILLIDDISYSSFDIGLQLGFKFGPSTK